MDKLEVFAAGLGMVEPWRVVEATFDPEQGRLDLRIDFPRGARFACPEGDEPACSVHDTEAKTWRHLDFFQHQAYLHARVPRAREPLRDRRGLRLDDGARAAGAARTGRRVPDAALPRRRGRRPRAVIERM